MNATFGRVLECDRALRRMKRFSYGEFVEGVAEGMRRNVEFGRAFDPALAERRQPPWRTLKRGTLHVVNHAAQASQFLAAARSTGTTVNQLR